VFSIECVFHRKCVIDMASNAGQVIIECVFYRMCILQIFYRYVIDMALTAGQDGMLEAGWELPSISLAARDPAAAVRICVSPCACLCAPGGGGCLRARVLSLSLARSLSLSLSFFLSLSLSRSLRERVGVVELMAWSWTGMPPRARSGDACVLWTCCGVLWTWSKGL
jgi:hypothetical protein